MKKLESLIEVLGSGDWEQKIEAASKLLEEGEKARDTLVLSLASENDDIRYWSLKVLGELNCGKYSFYAEPMLEDEAWFVRSEAAIILSDTGKSQYVPFIEKALQDEENDEAKEYFKKAIDSLKKQ
ncbi:MAG: hypothetical protein C0601_04565 [Candidatus Muiribacterium halophilum]|uniref:HEAT repeat domain-containing protein n=1 Tax=Muiribacterium halophilum TaxID=2053465 RepID=A0A2N5ZIC3_MUIH1|nr:MAG: hypothetical protein C0601_04565 [Candidatus Muirbacterium halophilum]